MTSSFADAATRHRRDAGHLAMDGRFQNAGHLIGFAAECLVKAELERVGVTIDKRLRQHFPDLTAQVGTHASGRLAGVVWGVIQSPQFLSGWRADRRYDANLDTNMARIQYAGWEKDVGDLFRVVRGVP